MVSLQSTSIESPEADNDVTVSQEYSAGIQLYESDTATSTCDWDCAITLKEGAIPPRATAPSIFQAYINEVLWEYLGRSVVAYIDDILIYSSSWDQHVHDIWAVPCTLLQNHLYCKLEKCEFHCKEVSFLGMVARPLTDLLHRVAKRLKCGAEVEKSFSELKEAFSTAPVLQQLDLGKPLMARREEREGGCTLLATPRRSPVYQHGSNTVTHLFPGNAKLGPGPTDRGGKSASALPAKPPLCPSTPTPSPYYVGTHLRGDRPPGATHTVQLLSAHYWWLVMPGDIVRYVESCTECSSSKVPRIPPAGKLLPLPTPRRPWSHLAIDFITDLPVSEDNGVILVIVDRFSKMVRFLPLKGLPTAWEMADHLFCHIFWQFRLLEDIVSDRGPQFTSRVWWLGFLRLYCQKHSETWSTYLPWVEYAQTSLWHVAAGLTPFECVLGFQPLLYPWNPPISDQLAVEMWCQRSEQMWEEAHQKLRKAIANYKRKVDRRRGDIPRYEPGQQMWVSMRDGFASTKGKLAARYEGPYAILQWIKQVTYSVGLPGHSRASRAFHESALKPVVEGPLAKEESSLSALSPPLEMEGGPAYK
ncbi:hypothetical protein P4O66_011786, partial [Electrophorus voltai]